MPHSPHRSTPHAIAHKHAGPDRARADRRHADATHPAYWSIAPATLLTRLHSNESGLSVRAAGARLRRHGANVLGANTGPGLLGLLWRQFSSPLVLILLAAAAVAALMRDWTDATIVLVIVIGSALLGFVQEHRASRALTRLRSRVQLTTRVVRGGNELIVPTTQIVPGDVVVLAAGSMIPADGVLLEAKDFFVTQSALTGESYPVEKHVATSAPDAALAERTNCVFMGTSVRSGTARALIVHTGTASVYGSLADRLRLRPPETEFERGLRHYGYLLTNIMLLLVLGVFSANVLLERAPVESMLFAIALAVGLSPELLPAIVTITLARGARAMADRGVIVRRLEAIENLGSMDILCTDKTGTLTLGVLALDGALDVHGRASDAVLWHAFANAKLQTGLPNPLDEAIVARGNAAQLALGGHHLLDEIPYDFVRKRLSVVVTVGAARTMITKGALATVLAVCDRVRDGEALHTLDAARRAAIETQFAQWSAQGYRVLGVAITPMPAQASYTRDDERSLVFAGFLLFLDPPKLGIASTLESLAALGVRVKIVTGDNRLVAAHLAESIGLASARIATGAELDQVRDEALWRIAEQTDLFAEVDPNQKERIIAALKKAGHVVGYLGDGINDVSALHVADVGISVEGAVDVARDAADFVLLESDLDVLRQGIVEGRITFANTLKYICTTTSANFGNMISMALASLYLPFLPLLAKQILFNNFLSDFPSMAIASDTVDPELTAGPRRWDITEVRAFMLVFGLVSSAFDLLTFGVLLFVFQTPAELFRTAWFVESLLTEIVIVLVLRTYRPFYRSRPGRLLVVATLITVGIAIAIPYLPFASMLEFVPIPPLLLAALLAITLGYVVATEYTKRVMHRAPAGTR